MNKKETFSLTDLLYDFRVTLLVFVQLSQQVSLVFSQSLQLLQQTRPLLLHVHRPTFDSRDRSNDHVCMFYLCGCTAKHPYCILSSLFSFFHCFLQRLLPLLGLGALQKKKHVSYVGLHHCICGFTHRWTRLPCVLPKNWQILLTTVLLKLQVMKLQNSVKNKASHIERGKTGYNK